MQYTYKLLRILTAVFCIPYFAADKSYLIGTGHFSIPSSKIPLVHDINTLRKNTHTGYGLTLGIPVRMAIGNILMAPEITYNKISIQSIKKKLIRQLPSKPLENEQTTMAINPLHWTCSDSGIDLVTEETFTQNSHLIGLQIKWHRAFLFQKINAFVAIMPFTGICLARIPRNYEDAEPKIIGQIAPFSIELGIQKTFSRNMFWSFSGKYIHPLQDRLPNYSLCIIEGGFGFSF